MSQGEAKQGMERTCLQARGGVSFCKPRASHWTHPAVRDFHHFAEHRREVPFQMQPWVLDLSPAFCSDKQKCWAPP